MRSAACACASSTRRGCARPTTRSRQKARAAHARPWAPPTPLLYVADAARGLDAEETADLERLGRERPDLPVLRIASKADLLGGAAPHGTLSAALQVSARDAAGTPALLDPLRDALLAALGGDAASPEADAAAVNERHRGHLAEAQAAVRRAQAALHGDADLLALDLRDALHALGLVSGAVTADDVLAAVFSRFCIGK